MNGARDDEERQRDTQVEHPRRDLRARSSTGNPSEKISHDGLTSSTLTLPVSRSRNVSKSMTAMPANLHCSKSAIGNPRAPIVHGHDDLVDVVRFREIEHRALERHDALVFERVAVALGRHERDDVEAAPIALPTQLQEIRGALAGAVHEHLATKRLRDRANATWHARMAPTNTKLPMTLMTQSRPSTPIGNTKSIKRENRGRHREGHRHAHDHAAEPQALLRLIEADGRHADDHGRAEDAPSTTAAAPA